jgi:phosphatidylglycerol---prolipoprotein diacylglyceryl transferase
MYPKLPFSIPSFTLFGHIFGPIYFYTYGLCMAVALGFSIYLFARDAGKYIAPKVGITYQQGFQKAFDLGVYVIVCSLLGARIFYVLENHSEFENGHWMDAVKIWQGGLVFYGGLFGAIAVSWFWIRVEKWPFSYTFDLVAPYILLGHAVGRVGCFLNGCCYGNVSDVHQGIFDLAHGWIFPGGEDQLPHLPTQLWELIGDLALFFLLLWVRRWTIRYTWLTISLYGLTYGLLRFIIEIWRLDRSVHFLITFRSASQATSGILVVLSLAAILWTLFKNSRRQSPGPI